MLGLKKLSRRCAATSLDKTQFNPKSFEKQKRPVDKSAGRFDLEIYFKR